MDGAGGMNETGSGSFASGSSEGVGLLMSIAYRMAESLASWSFVIVPDL